MDQFDIFESLNVELPQKTSKQKKTGKSKETSPKAKEETYSLPLILYTGYHDPIKLEDEEKKALSQKELSEKISCAFPEYSGCLYRHDKKAGNIYAYFKPNALITKGRLKVTAETRMMLGNGSFDLSRITQNRDCDVDITELSKIVTEKIPLLKGAELGFYYIPEPNIIIPKLPEKGIPKTARFPVTVLLPERGMFKISKEMYEAEGIKKDVPDASGIAKIVEKKWPELSQGFGIYYAQNAAILSPKFEPADSTNPQEELIPVVGTVISLVFAKIALTPDMFGGAEEVSKNDIIRLLSKEYPEYSKSRTEIIYDKDMGLIIPVLKGSRKGVGLIPLLKDPIQMQEQEIQYLPYYKSVHGEKVRVENTPVARFQKSKNTVAFQYHLPKIPGSIYEKCLEIFTKIMSRHNTEAMLQLFYDTEKKSYFLHCPKQSAGYAQVYAERDYRMEQKYLLVMDIHSHGRINCSFSPTDDEDEKGTRFYCVFYNLADEASCDIRCGCAGTFSPVQPETLFEFQKQL